MNTIVKINNVILYKKLDSNRRTIKFLVPSADRSEIMCKVERE